jgi:signal peptidase I
MQMNTRSETMEIYHPKDDELLREMKRVRRAMKRKRLLTGLLVFLVLGCIFGWFVFNRYCTLAVFHGPAMGDTLADGSLVLVKRSGGDETQQGDIILYETGTGTQIKRIMAREGDQVIVSPYVHLRVNGVTLEEPETTGRNMDAGIRTRRLTVEEGTLFMEGDQLSLSVDSRYPDYEVVLNEDVIGKVRFVLWPIYRIGAVNADEPVQEGGE